MPDTPNTEAAPGEGMDRDLLVEIIDGYMTQGGAFGGSYPRPPNP